MQALKKLLEYNHWCNTQIIEIIQQMRDEDYYHVFPIPFKTMHGLLWHLFYYDAKQWYRIHPHLRFDKSDINLSKSELIKLIHQYSLHWLDWIEGKTALRSTISLQENLLEEMFDLQSHNAYHRGQIYMLFSILGYQSPSFDIFFYSSLCLNKQ